MKGRSKQVIRAADAVLSVRSGVTDEALMEKYRISAKGLESLFRKLVKGGHLDQSELDQRMAVSQRSHLVDLVSSPTFRPSKIKININKADAVKSFRSGMSDLAIMAKYNISARGLDSLSSKLVKAGEILQIELDSRRLALGWAEDAFIDPSRYSPTTPEQDGSDSDDGSDLPEPENGRGRLYWTAGLGAIAGMALLAAILVMTHGVNGSLNGPVTPPSAQPASRAGGQSLQTQADHVIRTLDAIAHDEQTKSASGEADTRKEYEECIRRCKRDYGREQDPDPALLVNCRKECVTLYGERVKKIRELYHGEP